MAILSSRRSEPKRKEPEDVKYPPEWREYITTQLERLRVPEHLLSSVIQGIWENYSEASRRNIISRVMRLKGLWNGKRKRSRPALQDFVREAKQNGTEK